MFCINQAFQVNIFNLTFLVYFSNHRNIMLCLISIGLTICNFIISYNMYLCITLATWDLAFWVFKSTALSWRVDFVTSLPISNPGVRITSRRPDAGRAIAWRAGTSGGPDISISRTASTCSGLPRDSCCRRPSMTSNYFQGNVKKIVCIWVICLFASYTMKIFRILLLIKIKKRITK